jgi:16S rRNA (cytosine967-C5)-methyltransferase
LQPDELYVVQDFHSQQVFRFLTDTDLIESRFGKKKPKVWDCCAGSGGKSILIHDLLEGHMELTVSDIRTKMRPLLQERFTRAGIGQVNWFTTDLSRSDSPIPDQQYDIIICDVPCTGSGTWSRHPEQLYFFDDKTIDTFSRLQRQIVTRALSRLADNGLLLYVTCSVFSAENEQNVDALCDSLQLHSLYRRLLDGTESRCDSLFTAVMGKKQDIPDKNQK